MRQSYVDQIETKIKGLCETTWEHRVDLSQVRDWLAQFELSHDLELDEQLQMLFLLSHFIYFGQIEIREILKSLFRDLYRTPLLHELRKKLANPADLSELELAFRQERDRTRFLGVGNPSESGVHILYYFRQVNSLPKSLFINSYEIFKRDGPGPGAGSMVRDKDIKHYVFIDDLCGSGTQATEYSKELIGPLKLECPDAKIYYLVMFATTAGLAAVRHLGCFHKVAAVFELDETFKVLDPLSRVFTREEPPFLRECIRATCVKYGGRIWARHALGYKDGQLVIGFHHNTPDNTLPIFWWDGEDGHPWIPIFRRYHKDYGW